jgi:hypothetical protein
MQHFKTPFFIALVLILPLAGCYFLSKNQRTDRDVYVNKSVKLVSPNPDHVHRLSLSFLFRDEESFHLAVSLGLKYDGDESYKTKSYSIEDRSLISKFCAAIESVKEMDIDSSISFASRSVPQMNVLFEKKDGTIVKDSELYCIALNPPAQGKAKIDVTIWKGNAASVSLVVWIDSSDMEKLWNSLAKTDPIALF